MKLLFIFTGGTIGSTACGETISVDAAKPYLLCEKYAERYPVDFTYDTLEPFTELSENLTGEHISLLMQTVKAHLSDGYDGIIVTHGTDTLSYSAAALGYALGNDTVPVCLVSANYPIEDPRSNGLANLHAAITLIRTRTAKGVFVLYRNDMDDETVCHRATRLSTSLALSDNVFSVLECPYGTLTEDGFVKNPEYTETPDEIDAPASLSLPARCAEILRIFPYPGMIYPAIPDGIRAILLDTYHSGTVDGKSPEAHAFLSEAMTRAIPVYVTDGAAYDSTRIFDEYGVKRLPLSPIAAYTKLWLYGTGDELTRSRGGDLFR